MTMTSSQTYNAGDVLTATSLTKHVTEATPTVLTAACDGNSQDLTGMDEVGFTDASANASSAGRTRRNGVNLTWHDGTAAGRLFYAGGTDVPVADGGTGLSSGTSGGILGYTASGTLASSVALTANAIVLGGGAGATPTPMTGTSGGVPYFNAATTVASSGALTANGVVYGGGAGAAPASTAQGGTNTILTANGGAPAWSATPTIETSVQIGRASTTTGELILGHASSANLTRFRAGNATEANTYIWPTDGGNSGQVLQTDGGTPTAVLSWLTPSAGVALGDAPTWTGNHTWSFGAGGVTTKHLRTQNTAGTVSTWLFNQNNSSSVETTMVQLVVNTDDTTAGSEDANLVYQTIIAGTLGTRMTLGAGLKIGAPTGGDKGAGTLNISGAYYADGTAGVASYGPAAVASITVKNGIITAIS